MNVEEARTSLSPKTEAEERMFKEGLFVLCDRLHGSFTGSSDPISLQETGAIRAYLHQRMKDWQPSHSHTVFYDNCVRILVIAALAEEA